LSKEMVAAESEPDMPLTALFGASHDNAMMVADVVPFLVLDL